MKRLLAGAMLSALASPLQAGWTVAHLGGFDELEGYETSIVSIGRNVNDICVSLSLVPILFNDFRGEVWCVLPDPFGNPVWTLLNRIVTTPTIASVSADTIRGDGRKVRWVTSDPLHGDIWYGIGGDTPELVSTNTPASSVSLSHFSDRTPFITYSGLNDHVYYATRVGGGWATFQLTNNVTTPNLRTVASVIKRDVVHVVYWDETYSAVRYGTAARGGGWTFETVHASPGVPLRPTIAADDEGRARVAFAHPDGKVHVFTRQPEGWIAETIDPSPNVAIGYREVALQVDRRGALHIAFSAGNGNTALILYARKPPGGTWGPVETARRQDGNQPDGFYGLSLALQEQSITVVPQVSYAYDVFLGVLGRVYRTND